MTVLLNLGARYPVSNRNIIPVREPITILSVSLSKSPPRIVLQLYLLAAQPSAPSKAQAIVKREKVRVGKMPKSKKAIAGKTSPSRKAVILLALVQKPKYSNSFRINSMLLAKYFTTLPPLLLKVKKNFYFRKKFLFFNYSSPIFSRI